MFLCNKNKNLTENFYFARQIAAIVYPHGTLMLRLFQIPFLTVQLKYVEIG